MKKTSYQPGKICKPVGEYSHGIKIKGGSFLFIAGQVALDSQGNLVGRGDIRAQAKQVFENIRAVLESAGGTFQDAVKLVIFLTNMEDFPAVREVRKQYLSEPFPIATVLEVKGLVNKDWLIEIEAIAAVD